MNSKVSWAKFKNPKTDKEFIVRDNNCGHDFCYGIECNECYVNWHIVSEENCSDWVKEHPLEAAEGMGYEFLCRGWEDGRVETREDLESLFFLCRWLKVQPGAIIRVNGWDWRVENDGTLDPVDGGTVWSTECQALYKILEHPELVEVVNMGLTEEEKETLGWLRKFVPAGSLVRWGEKEEWLEVTDSRGIEVILTIMPSLFPSLKPGWILHVTSGDLVMDREG